MKRRVMSAFFLILIALPLIIAGEKVFAIAVGVVGIFALKEIIDLKKGSTMIPFSMALLFYLNFLFVVYIGPFEFSDFVGIHYRLLSFLFVCYLLPTLYYHSKKRYTTTDAFYFLCMTLFLGFACHCLIMVRIQGLWEFLYLILIPILTDTFALIFGKLIGRHLLSPVISPQKTWEGSIFGSFCATIICSVFYFVFVSPMNVVPLFILTLLLSIASQFGDLLFSAIKREHHIKDFSDLIPGHGGILDRFDSIIFSSVVFALLACYF